jgi:hypothetical protein
VSGERLQAFIDESYDKGGNYVLGGFISTQSRWALLSREWENALKFGTLAEGSNIYHFKHSEMHLHPERAKRIKYFYSIARRHTIMALSCKINVAEMEAAQKRLVIPGIEIDFGPFSDPFKLSVRCLLDNFHSSRLLFSKLIAEDQIVDFIFDEQMGNDRLIRESWSEYVNSRDPRIASTYGRAPSFMRDHECYPLQAADMWAGTVRKAFLDGSLDSIKVNYEEDYDLQPWVHMEWNEDQLFEAFAGMARDFTDNTIFDVRYGDSWHSWFPVK